MKVERKIKWLIASCVVIVGTLSFIQYALVLNTYKLTKEKYYTEIRSEIGKLINRPSIAILEEKTQEKLKHLARLFVLQQIDKATLFAKLNKSDDVEMDRLKQQLFQDIQSNKILKDLKYKAQYDEILITFNGKTDTLLSTREAPFVFLGSPFQTPNTLLIGNGSNTIVDSFPKADGSGSSSIKLQIQRAQYLEVSTWKAEVWKRMAGIYLLAFLMIVAVIILYYLVFSAMFRQKRLAEIKTDFANNITHELKTPLSSVGLILKSLEREEVRSNPQLTDELLASLNRQHFKIQKLVDFVLETALTSPHEVKKISVDITSYLQDYVKELRTENHQFTSSIPPEKHHVLINLEILDKILNNLIENALKYSPEGTVISLKSKVMHRKYRIEITDEGPGIPLAYQPFIFDKFFRIPTHNQHDVKGLGLGLYLSKQAANLIGAELIMESRSGAGSTFILEIKYG